MQINDEFSPKINIGNEAIADTSRLLQLKLAVLILNHETIYECRTISNLF